MHSSFLCHTECNETTFSYNGSCFASCPVQTYVLPEKLRAGSRKPMAVPPHERAVISDASQKQCADCHTTCYRCRGPNAYDCIECSSGFIHRIVTANESYCDTDANPQKILKLFDGDHNANVTVNDFSHKNLLQTLLDYDTISMVIVSVYVMAFLVFLLILRIVYVKCCATASDSHTDKKNYAYNRIAYDGTNDHIIMEQDMLHTISDSSDEIEPNK